MILTGSSATALEMERFGVVNRAMSPGEDVLEATLEMARKVASSSAPAVRLAKQAVLAGELILSKVGWPRTDTYQPKQRLCRRGWILKAPCTTAASRSMTVARVSRRF